MKKWIATIKSLMHWYRMRRWVKTQDPTSKPAYTNMQYHINECWYGMDCALCAITENCIGCPLVVIKEDCGTGSPWYSVATSHTWGDWLKASDGMIKALWLALFVG